MTTREMFHISPGGQWHRGHPGDCPMSTCAEAATIAQALIEGLEGSQERIADLTDLLALERTARAAADARAAYWHGQYLHAVENGTAPAIQWDKD